MQVSLGAFSCPARSIPANVLDAAYPAIGMQATCRLCGHVSAVSGSKGTRFRHRCRCAWRRLFGQDMRAVSDIAFGCRLPKRTVARFLTFRIRRLPANLKKGRASACDRWCSSVAVYTICPQGVFSTCLRIREKTFNHDIDPYAMY